MPDQALIHATTISVGDTAMAIMGPSSVGKTSLALDCLAIPAGPFCRDAPELVADDQTRLLVRGDDLIVEAPVATRGLVEVTGLGLICFPHRAHARLLCVLDLVNGAVPRLPETPAETSLLGRRLPVAQLSRDDPSRAVKALCWLAICAGDRERLANDALLGAHRA